ncbi:MAG TPA: hypothetical protein VD997_02515 [Phycisphaerales bacterium]|nr:hypothetical protein [Phycisphaerales bacterium]
MHVAVIAGLLLFAFVLVLITSFGIARRFVGVDCCAECRYSLEGLSVERCPECGQELAGEGALRGGSHEYLYDPPAVLKWFCRVLLMALYTGVFVLVVMEYSPRTYVDSIRYTLVHEGWTAEFRARGTRDGESSQDYGTWPVCVPRPSVTMTVRTDEGEVATVRLLDLLRRAVLTDARGRRMELANTVTVADLEEWGSGFANPGIRDAIVSSAAYMDQMLAVCATGSTLGEPDERWQWWYPRRPWWLIAAVGYAVSMWLMVGVFRRLSPVLLRR